MVAETAAELIMEADTILQQDRSRLFGSSLLAWSSLRCVNYPLKIVVVMIVEMEADTILQ